MKKHCSTCDTDKASYLFDANRLQCKQCRNAYVTAWRKRNPEKYAATTALAARTLAGRYAAFKAIAKKRGGTDITRLEYLAMVSSPCHYCGFPLNETGTGIDRKRPGEMYHKDNCVPACWECNMKKHDMFTYEEALELGKVIRAIKLRRLNGDVLVA